MKKDAMFFLLNTFRMSPCRHFQHDQLWRRSMDAAAGRASPDYSSYEGKASHSADGGASLGASGHPSEKHADFWGAWLRARILPRRVLHHSKWRAASRYRPIARDRRGLLLRRCRRRIIRASRLCGSPRLPSAPSTPLRYILLRCAAPLRCARPGQALFPGLAPVSW